MLPYYQRADVIINDLLKSVQSKIDRNESSAILTEVEILSDVVRFFGKYLKPVQIQTQFELIKNLINNKKDLPFDMMVILLSSYTKYFKLEEINEIIDKSNIKDDFYRKMFNFVTYFNGSMPYFNTIKKNIMKNLKPMTKEHAVIILKSVGKIINKYKFFIEIEPVEIKELLENYEKIIEQICLETDIISSVNSTNILDAHLCVFILSLGYLQLYDENMHVLHKLLNFVIKLIEQSKVNNQLLVNCLSLLVLKTINQTPDRDFVLEALYKLEVDEKDVKTIEGFLKKIYYFNK